VAPVSKREWRNSASRTSTNDSNAPETGRGPRPHASSVPRGAPAGRVRHVGVARGVRPTADRGRRGSPRRPQHGQPRHTGTACRTWQAGRGRRVQ
jgi:hypothetical protein